MIISVRDTYLIDLDIFIKVPLHRILLDFLNCELFLWVNTNKENEYGIDMSVDAYSEYQLNDLISEYIKQHSYEKLMRFQTDLRRAAAETFLGHEQKTQLFASDSINYSIGYSNGEISEIYKINSIEGYCVFALARLSGSDTIIRKCENCSSFFIPASRSDEIYCDRVFKGDKTCKEVGYEMKVQNDPITKAYRNAYKTKNAYKLRNIKNITGIEKRFNEWVTEAKIKLEATRAGKISLDEFISWLKGDI